MKVFSILLVPMFALSLAAFAQDDMQSPNADPDQSDAASSAPPQRQPGAGKQKFIKADANGDGRLSRDEAKAMPFVSKRFNAIDTNRDGYVTRDELHAAHQRMQAARAQRARNQSGDAAPSVDDQSARTN